MKKKKKKKKKKIVGYKTCGILVKGNGKKYFVAKFLLEDNMSI